MNEEYRGNKKSEFFFDRPTLEVAEDLLDKILITKKDGTVCGGRIVETEAYLSENDPACHAAGKVTKRNKVMYGPPGTVYLYKIYGMHLCFNLVTEPEGIPAAVLIRAIQPDFGIKAMAERRGTDNIYNLASGPGKLTQALGMEYVLNNKSLDETYISVEKGRKTSRDKGRSSRIGISRARDLKYRFFINGNRFVSRRRGKTGSVKKGMKKTTG